MSSGYNTYWPVLMHILFKDWANLIKELFKI